MPENKVQLIISAADDGKLLNIIKRAEGNIDAFGNKTLSMFKRTGEGINAFSQKYINGLETIGIGVGFTMMAKDVMDFDGSLRKIGRTAGLNSTELQGLRQDILNLIAPNAKLKMPISKNEWAEIATELNITGIKLNTIKEIMPQIGKGAVASGVHKGIYAATIGELLKKYKIAVEELPALQEQLNTAMKFEDVRKNPEAFLQGIQAMSKSMQLIKTFGLKNATSLIAMSSQLTSFTGSPQEAVSSLETLLDRIRTLAKNEEKLAVLKKHKIEFFDSKGAMKNIKELTPELRKFGKEAEKYGGVEVESIKLFERPEAAKAMMMILEKYDEIIKKQEELKKSTGGLEQDFTTENNSMGAKLQEFQNQIDSFKVEHISNMLEHLSKGMDVLNEHPLISKGILTGGGLLVGSAVLMKTAGVFKDVFNFGKYVLTGKKGGVQEVFVTNMPGGGGIISGGNTDVLMGGGGIAKGTGTFSKVGGIAKKAIPFLFNPYTAAATVGVAAGYGTVKAADYLTDGGYSRVVGKPAEWLYDYMHPQEKTVFNKEKIEKLINNERIERLITPMFMQEAAAGSRQPPIKNNIVMNIHIDRENRAFVENPANTESEVNLNRGSFNN